MKYFTSQFIKYMAILYMALIAISAVMLFGGVILTQDTSLLTTYVLNLPILLFSQPVIYVFIIASFLMAAGKWYLRDKL